MFLGHLFQASLQGDAQKVHLLRGLQHTGLSLVMEGKFHAGTIYLLVRVCKV